MHFLYKHIGLYLPRQPPLMYFLCFFLSFLLILLEGEAFASDGLLDLLLLAGYIIVNWSKCL